MAPLTCFSRCFLSVNKAKEELKPLIFVPASLPTSVKDHLAGFVYTPPESVSILGIDDWAWKKGVTYGTIWGSLPL